MSYQIIVTVAAREQETEAYLFYENKSEGLGEAFLDEVADVLHKIAENPTFYSYTDSSKRLRDTVLNRFPFVVIFDVVGDKIVVTNIHHTKKDLK